MSFAANLSKARSHLIIVFGLITASALIMTIEAREPKRLSASLPAFRHAPTAAERRAAAWAWSRIPENARTPDLRVAAERLGALQAKPVAVGADEAAAILRSLDQ
jgi:hypothetical protein